MSLPQSSSTEANCAARALAQSTPPRSSAVCAARACAEAASNGQLETLQWMRSQDPPCPWDERTCSEAARYGRLSTLQWLRSQDPPCPWDPDVCFDGISDVSDEAVEAVQDFICTSMGWSRSSSEFSELRFWLLRTHSDCGMSKLTFQVIPDMVV